MGDQAHGASETGAQDYGHEHSHHGNYVKIYWVLLALLVVSILGPELGIRWVTLITAFGIAIVKAYLVAKNFMHINFAPRYVAYLVSTCLVFMLLFFAGTAPDVMKFEGTNWVKPAWETAHAEAASGAGEHGGAAHH
jgi:caa(3)-type oxidase subunit IV